MIRLASIKAHSFVFALMFIFLSACTNARDETSSQQKQSTTSDQSNDAIPSSVNSFLDRESSLNTISYAALKHKLTKVFKLADDSKSLQFATTNQKIWTSQKELSEGKYRFIVDLANILCTEVDMTEVGLTSSEGKRTLFKRLTGYKFPDELDTNIDQQATSISASDEDMKAHLYCMGFLLSPHIWMILGV